jgi:hypothetical protein
MAVWLRRLRSLAPRRLVPLAARKTGSVLTTGSAIIQYMIYMNVTVVQTSLGTHRAVRQIYAPTVLTLDVLLTID